MNRTRRSSMSASSSTSKRRAASATGVPGCSTRYGTMTSNLPRRSEARAVRGRLGDPASSTGKEGLQPTHDLLAQRRRLDDAGVGAEAQDPRCQRVVRAGGDAHGDPPVVGRLADLRIPQPCGRPPRDVDVIGGPEAAGRLAPLPGVANVGRDPRESEGPDIIALAVEADDVPVPG